MSKTSPSHNGLGDLDKTKTQCLGPISLSILLEDHVKTRELCMTQAHLLVNNKPDAIIECLTSFAQMQIGRTSINNSGKPRKDTVLYTELEMTCTRFERICDCLDLMARSLRYRDKQADVEETTILDLLCINLRSLLKGFNKDRVLNLTMACSPTAEEDPPYDNLDVLHRGLECICDRAELLSIIHLRDSDSDVKPSNLWHAEWQILQKYLSKTREMNWTKQHLPPIVQQESSETFVISTESL
ncbi:hypothetical protein BS47DRAFT_1402993 [Hydnum rufescens UP504]|uniref:Uncharacterized protein n=1 Tax=Hydnum rufescens UP504 TaxID=1448309 RepID=A0A9P6AC08_9AGAM|nr:hypothetical protein BS47DRAFT_1402993 [Hydnum rufescens UP504]